MFCTPDSLLMYYPPPVPRFLSESRGEKLTLICSLRNYICSNC